MTRRTMALTLLSSGLVWAGLSAVAWCAERPQMHTRRAYNGFDRNDYPGDALLDGLRASFSYAGYWLNAPPGEKATSWTGKRELLRQKGFGFLILFNGRLYAQLKGKDAAALGRADAQGAVAAAQREGFPRGAMIFLDQEEGGRLLPEQMAYVLAWVDFVRRLGWRSGVYCSGIEVQQGGAASTDPRSTAEDLERQAGSWKIPLWVARDECPPSPGCVVEGKPELPSELGLPGAVVWQYAMSPRRAQFTAACPRNYAADNNCYAPGVAASAKSFIDLNVAESPDPSDGR
ncbi:MAG: glycoside hydrolase domain-containing protein [Acidobacteriaceae bacterium]